jgi:hypothetical protein
MTCLSDIGRLYLKFITPWEVVKKYNLIDDLNLYEPFLKALRLPYNDYATDFY